MVQRRSVRRLLLVLTLLVAPASLAAPGATGPAAGAGPAAISYDLGEATIVQPQYPASSPLHEIPVSLRGVIAIPPGAGPFPVAVIVHGSYRFCTAPLVGGEVDPYPCPAEDDLRQYTGFAYLAEALAQRGFLAFVPDLAASFNNGVGEPMVGDRATQLLEAHLDALEHGEGFGAVAASAADLDRLVLAGHSQGGPLAIHYLRDARWATRDVSALALVAPAAAPPETKVPLDLPAALVVAMCDGDVRPEQSLAYLDQQLPVTRPSVTLTLAVPGGTHNAFSTSLGPDPVAICHADELLPADAQRELLAGFLPRFFDLALAYPRR